MKIRQETKAGRLPTRALRFLVAEWIQFTLFGILSPTIKLKVCTFGGLMNSATKV